MYELKSKTERFLVLHKPEDYKSRVHDYVMKYATEDALKDRFGADENDDDSESTISDISYDNDMEMDDGMEM